MLLKELTRYYFQNRNVMPAFGWELHHLRWVIVIHKNGWFCDIQDLATFRNPKRVHDLCPKKSSKA